MFGFGKKKMYFGQTSRLVATSLINQGKIDYDEVDAIGTLFDDTEIEYINNELFLLRFTSLSFSFAIIALEKRLSISSFDIGNIVAQGTKLAFEDSGYLDEHIKFLGMKFNNDMDYITTNLEAIPFDRDVYLTSIALSFTDNFFNSLGYTNVDEAKRTALFVCATSVVCMVLEIVEDFLKNVKVIDFK